MRSWESVLSTAVAIAAFVFLAAPGPAAAVHPAGHAARHDAPDIALTAPSVDVPMDLATGRPVIELSLNGHGPYQFVFDTGAGGMVIDAGLARELSLPVVGRDSLGDPNNPGAYQVDVVKLDAITLGGA